MVFIRNLNQLRFHLTSFNSGGERTLAFYIKPVGNSAAVPNQPLGAAKLQILAWTPSVQINYAALAYLNNSPR